MQHLILVHDSRDLASIRSGARFGNILASQLKVFLQLIARQGDMQCSREDNNI